MQACCTPFRQSISREIDQEISAEERERLQAHLALCQECRIFAQRCCKLEEKIQLLRETTPNILPASLHSAGSTPPLSPWLATQVEQWFEQGCHLGIQVLFNKCHGNCIETAAPAVRLQKKAAGVATSDMPIVPDIVIPQTLLFCKTKFAITFRFDKSKKRTVYMQFQGSVDPMAIARLEIQIFYKKCQEPEIFYGKDRIEGGAWPLPLEKVAQIERISLLIRE